MLQNLSIASFRFVIWLCVEPYNDGGYSIERLTANELHIVHGENLIDRLAFLTILFCFFFFPFLIGLVFAFSLFFFDAFLFLSILLLQLFLRQRDTVFRDLSPI